MCRVQIPKGCCEDQFHVVEPQINAEGIHVWPFDPSLPLDVRFLTCARRQNVRMNRHDYFELIYLCAGSTNLKIQNRSLPFREGDLAVVGSTLYHSVECSSAPPFTLASTLLSARSDSLRWRSGYGRVSDSFSLSGSRVPPCRADQKRNPEPGVRFDAAHPNRTARHLRSCPPGSEDLPEDDPDPSGQPILFLGGYGRDI
jgi:hypothetical protein